MKPQAYKTKSGQRWRARWWNAELGREMSRGSFATKAEAEDYTARIRVDKAEKGRQTVSSRYSLTLNDLALKYTDDHATVHLAPITQRNYGRAYDRLIGPELGAYRLVQLVQDPSLLSAWVARLHKRGVGTESTGYAISVLSAIFSKGVDWQQMTTNPARVLRKPPRAVKDEDDGEAMPATRAPITPLAVERLRWHLLTNWDGRCGRPSREARLRDWAMAGLLSWSFLRPGEALALRWEDLDFANGRIKVSKSVSLGELKAPKTKEKGRHQGRSALLPTPLAAELQWLKEELKVSANDRIFPHVTRAMKEADQETEAVIGYWPLTTYRNWSKRTWSEGAKTVASNYSDGTCGHLAASVPYTGRHTGINLALAQYTAAEVARFAGHRVDTMHRWYGDAVEGYEGKPSQDYASIITAAQAQLAAELAAIAATKMT